MQVNDVAFGDASGYGLMDDIRGFLNMAVAEDEGLCTEGDWRLTRFIPIQSLHLNVICCIEGDHTSCCASIHDGTPRGHGYQSIVRGLVIP